MCHLIAAQPFSISVVQVMKLTEILKGCANLLVISLLRYRLVELKVNLDKNCTKLEISLFEAECHP